MATVGISNILAAQPIDAGIAQSVESCIRSFTGTVFWSATEPTTRIARIILKLNKASHFVAIVQFKKGTIVNLATGEYGEVDQFDGTKDGNFKDWTVDTKSMTIGNDAVQIDPLTYEFDDSPNTHPGYKRSYEFITAVFDRRKLVNANPYDPSLVYKSIIGYQWDAKVVHYSNGSYRYGW